VATSPVVLFPDHDRGAWFSADRPLAVYFLERQRLVVEVQCRPKYVSKLQEALAAPIWLRIGTLSSMEHARRVPVWPRLVFSAVDLEQEADDCRNNLGLVARQAFIHRALIVHSDPATGLANSTSGEPKVTSIGIAPSGQSLLDGFNHIARVLRDEIAAQEEGR
jgi:hypothetical protein